MRYSLCWLIPVLACSTPSSDPGQVLVRDSAGVRIVANAIARAGDTGLRLDPQPRVAFGVSSDDPLVQVRGIIRLSDGTVVICNAGFHELLFYRPDGVLFKKAGGQGGGPGEFLGPSGLTNVWLVRGDTVAAWEHSRSRLSLFDAQGEYVDGFQVRARSSAFPMALGIMDGHRVVVRLLTEREPERAGEVYRDSVRYVLYHPDGLDAEEVATLPGYERIGYEFRGRVSMGRRPFARDPVSVASGTRYFHSTGDAFAIRVYERTELSMIIQAPDGDRALRPAEIEQYKQELMKQAPPPADLRREWRRAFDEAPYPDQVPAVRRIVIGAEGRIWVRRFERPGMAEVRWSVFTADGRWEMDAVTPTAIRVWEIGANDVVGVWTDEYDVERAGVFGFSTSAPGR